MNSETTVETLSIDKLLASEAVPIILRILVIIIIGLFLLKTVSSLSARIVKNRSSPQNAMLTRKMVFYGGFSLLFVMILQELGFSLAALLGAAGIAGIALGFASQTSLSNVISGIFLISEKPFQIDDIIRVGDTVGMVLSIDLLSVKLRKFDNTFVRIPNESLIKSELTNITRFPIRRFDLDLSVAYREDIKKVTEVLHDIVSKNKYALEQPEPLIAFTGFGESALKIFVGVWFSKTDFMVLRETLLPEIKRRFEEEGIEIPFPHRTLYTGSVTNPFPVKMVDD